MTILQNLVPAEIVRFWMKQRAIAPPANPGWSPDRLLNFENWGQLTTALGKVSDDYFFKFEKAVENRESGYVKKFYDLKYFIIFDAHLLAQMGGKFQQLSRANDGNAVDCGDNSMWLCHQNIDG